MSSIKVSQVFSLKTLQWTQIFDMNGNTQFPFEIRQSCTSLQVTTFFASHRLTVCMYKCGENLASADFKQPPLQDTQLQPENLSSYQVAIWRAVTSPEPWKRSSTKARNFSRKIRWLAFSHDSWQWIIPPSNDVSQYSWKRFLYCAWGALGERER